MALGLQAAIAIFRKVILPQAFIVALRPLGNEVILMIKGSAVAAIVTVFDLMGVDPPRLRALVRPFGLSLGGGPLSDPGRVAPPRLGPARAPADRATCSQPVDLRAAPHCGRAACG